MSRPLSVTYVTDALARRLRESAQCFGGEQANVSTPDRNPSFLGEMVQHPGHDLPDASQLVGELLMGQRAVRPMCKEARCQALVDAVADHGVNESQQIGEAVCELMQHEAPKPGVVQRGVECIGPHEPEGHGRLRHGARVVS